MTGGKAMTTRTQRDMLRQIELLESRLADAHDEIDRWKTASGLMRGGCPGGVTPEDLATIQLRVEAAETYAWHHRRACGCNVCVDLDAAIQSARDGR